MGQNGSLSQIKNCSMPCGAKLREDMWFGLLVREAKIKIQDMVSFVLMASYGEMDN